MNRKRTVAAASGISAVLVAGSSAFAVANGIFVARPVGYAGALRTTRAQLVPRANLGTTSTTHAVPRPRLLALPVTAPAAAPFAPPAVAISLPATTSPPLVARANTAPIARSGPSALPGNHTTDDHEVREDDHGDE